MRVTVPVSLAISKIFSIKNGVTLKTALKMAPFDRPYATIYWWAIVNIAISCVPFSAYLTLNNIVTLKSGLEVTQCH